MEPRLRPRGPSFPLILALWAFISFHFGLVGFHFLSFWLFGGQLLGFWAPRHHWSKTVRCPNIPYKEFISARPGSILQFPFILALWALFSFHFGFVGLHFLLFWPFGPSFPLIFTFWAFISLHFGFLMASLWAPPASCQKRSVFPMSHTKNLAAPNPAPFSNFWPFGPSFPFIFAFLAFWAFISFHFLAFWAFISFHFSIVGRHFLSFWPCGPSFPFILALSFHFALGRIHLLAFWPFRGPLRAPPPQVAKNGPFS